MTNQASRQSSYRAIGSTTTTFTGDARAAFEAEATIPSGASYNGAFIAWLQNRLSSSVTNLNGLLAEWAADESVDRYTAIGSFDPTPP